MAQPEMIDIGITKLTAEPTLTIHKEPKQAPRVNFGPGIDLLMNERTLKKSPSDSDIQSLDIDNLENQLNALTVDSTPHVLDTERENVVLKIDDTVNSEVGLGESTNRQRPEESFDGFKRFNDIPVDPTVRITREPSLTGADLLKEKFAYLRKLESLQKRGIELSRKYTVESNLHEMKAEYDMIKDEKERQNSVQFQGKILMACVTGLEYLNGKIDPFDLKLDGWGESVNENITDYDDVFGELHEKYKFSAKMAPELKLLFMLGGSGLMVHMTNAMFKSSIPGMDDIMRQNPELMQQFTRAAAQSMTDQNPGFGNFMSGMMDRDTGGPGASEQMPFDRPAKTPRYQVPDSRPDMRQDMDDGIDIHQLGTPAGSPEMERTPRSRPEMKGPSNIDEILAGLKTKQQESETTKTFIAPTMTQKDPTIKKKKKRISEKNAVNLDI